jgi:hypothetical protein
VTQGATKSILDSKTALSEGARSTKDNIQGHNKVATRVIRVNKTARKALSLVVAMAQVRLKRIKSRRRASKVSKMPSNLLRATRKIAKRTK